MTRVTISDEVHALIKMQAEYEFKDEGHRLLTGDWKVRISDETLARLGRHALRGESVSDTLLRLLTAFKTGTN